MSQDRSLLLRRDVIEALRRGTVPRRGLDLFAVGTERFEVALTEELERVASGGGVFKAIRGDFGCGESFSRERSLNALRQLIDDVYGGRFPGLYVLITGTPAFFDGPHGVRRSPPLAQRLHMDFDDDSRFDNCRDVQLRLQPFDLDRLVQVGRRVRDLFPSENQERLQRKVTDEVISSLAAGVAGKLGGRVGVAPRIFLRKLVAGLLDRVDVHPDFEPTEHFQLLVDNNELTAEERHAAGVERSVDEIELDLSAGESEGGLE